MTAERSRKTVTMHISAKADYAVRALVELAADSAQPQTCEGIATTQGIPFRFLKSVFRDLRSAGLVRSQRGCEGGYWLGRDAGTITVAEVMRAVDGEFFTLRGERLDDVTYPGTARRLPDTWRAVEAAADGILGTVTLADLVEAEPAGTYEPGGGTGPDAAAAVTV